MVARIADPMRRGMSTCMTFHLSEMFLVMRAASPRTKRMLVMLLPSTLPMTMPVWCVAAATRDDASSGRLVPRPTMMRPTRKGDMPRRRPMRSAFVVKMSDDLMRRKRPKARRRR